MDTDIQKFYKGKSIFLTGGSGFVGKAFIEKALRSTEVERIYVLLRPKKGKDIAERVKDIFRDPVFEKLHEQQKDASKRVTAIAGDCTLADLGLKPDDRQLLITNVDVVVHSAATVRFNEPLKSALTINVRATKDLIRLAKQMVKLKAFVHVSSAFSNCTLPHIGERYYVDQLGSGSDGEDINRLVDEISDISEKDLDQRSEQICGNFPNTYCFTKALAEEVVLTDSDKLPIAVFRPGIVVPTCKEPIPGWIDNFYGPTSILCGVASGVLRVMYMREQQNANFVPVDYCVNLMLVVAYRTALDVDMNRRCSVPPIYNLVPDERNKLRWVEYRRVMTAHGAKMPLSRMLWFPFFIPTNSKILYKVLQLFLHTIPGYLHDFYLLLAGRRRRMVKMYKKIHIQLELLEYFVENNWTFSMDNTIRVWESLSEEEKRLFPFDMLSIDWSEYFYNSLVGMRRFIAKEEPETVPKGLLLLRRLWVLHWATLATVSGGLMAFLCYFCLSMFNTLRKTDIN